MALQTGQLAPTGGYIGPDAQCPIAVVTAPQTAQITTAMSNSFAFGGLNGVLVLKRG